jgi:hypothetical protein
MEGPTVEEEHPLSPRSAPIHRILSFAAVICLSATFLTLGPLAVGASGSGGGGPVSGPRHQRPRPSTPALIHRAVEAGGISRIEEAQLLTYALSAPTRLPAAYRSDTPWDGTVPLLQLQYSAPSLGRGPAARAVRAGIAQITDEPCPGAHGTLPALRTTAHFYVQYSPSGLVGLGITAYTRALERVWNIEVESFGWAAPPRNTAQPATGGRYPVRVQRLGTGLYGYVTRTRIVGNNPHTSWADHDAMASCMVLNQNFVPFPGTPTTALHATAAHEFNHSLQFGYGALSGSTRVKSVWVEGGATWMEDEVFDSANDNYNYLWPDLTKPMPLFDPTFPYPYWVVFRAMTEQFGTGTAGGGQRIFRYFWEQLSRNTSTNTDAFKRAFKSVGTTMAVAYHRAGIALRFDVGCGGTTPEPYCLQEGPAYVDATMANPQEDNNTVSVVGNSVSTSVANDFATRWVGLPAGHLSDIYPVSVDVDPGDEGILMVSLVCHSGEDITVTTLGAATGSIGVTTTMDYDASGCDEVTAVISNVAETSTSPTSRTTTHFTISTM